MRFDGTTLSYTQYKLSANFRTGGTGTTLRLTDFDADGVPEPLGRLGRRDGHGVRDLRPLDDRDRKDQGQGRPAAV